MPIETDPAKILGEEDPLLADGRKAPERREVSIRWLSGTFLTGITSSALMGIALFAALDGREQLAIPGEAFAAADIGAGAETTGGTEKGERLVGTAIAAKPSDREIVEISTMIQEGDRRVVRSRPFAHVKIALAANHSAKADYPKFNPLKIFSSGKSDAAEEVETGSIYGAEVDSEIRMKVADYPVRGAPYAYAASMSATEAEEIVRTNGAILTDETFQVAMLHYMDPARFGSIDARMALEPNLNARVVAENVSVSHALPGNRHSVEFVDDVIAIRKDKSMANALIEAGYNDSEAKYVAEVLALETGSKELKKGSVFRISLEQRGEHTRIVRASVYDGTSHIASVALNDQEIMVPSQAPAPSPAVATAFDDIPIAVASGRDLPRIYDGIFKASLSYGMTVEMTEKIIRMLASNVDYRARLKPTDTLEAVFSVNEETREAYEDSELLYVAANIGNTTVGLYRFRNPEDGSLDYYDEEGRSARQFLLRNPVPNGRFTSGSECAAIRSWDTAACTRASTGPHRAARRSSPRATAWSRKPAGVVATANRRSSATPMVTSAPTRTRPALPRVSRRAPACVRAKSSAMWARRDCRLARTSIMS